MALPGAGGISLPDGSVGCVPPGGIGCFTVCSPDHICLVLLVGLLCVGAEGVFLLSVTWTSLLQDVGLFLLVAGMCPLTCVGSGMDLWVALLCEFSAA